MKVFFRAWPNGDIIALWRDGSASVGMVSSYMHVGQHGDASPDLLGDLRPATPEELGPLWRELLAIGYKGITPADDDDTFEGEHYEEEVY